MALAFVIELAADWRRRDCDGKEVCTNLAIGAGFLAAGLGWSFLTAGAFYAVWSVTPLRFDMTSGWSWLVLFLVRDFLFYWSHRASHTFGFMWASHHVHHSTPRLNFGTAMRNSWIGGGVDWLFWMPLAAIGFDPLSITTMHMVASAHNFLAHCGHVPRLGFIDVVFVTPRNHRVHHSVELDEQQCNFGAVLTVWDRLFGTFRPVARGPLVFGVEPMPARRYDPVALELGPWASYLRGLPAAIRGRRARPAARARG